jgi:hypothetical protein
MGNPLFVGKIFPIIVFYHTRSLIEPNGDRKVLGLK